MKKNRAGNGMILTGQAKVDHDARVQANAEKAAQRKIDDEHNRQRRISRRQAERLDRTLRRVPPGPGPLAL